MLSNRASKALRRMKAKYRVPDETWDSRLMASIVDAFFITLCAFLVLLSVALAVIILIDYPVILVILSPFVLLTAFIYWLRAS